MALVCWVESIVMPPPPATYKSSASLWCYFCSKMSVLSVLEELGRKLVYQQDAWSESVILHGEKVSFLTATESYRLNSLLMDVYRWLAGLRQVNSDVLVIEPHIVSVHVAYAAPPTDHVSNASVGALPQPRSLTTIRTCVKRSSYYWFLSLPYLWTDLKGADDNACQEGFHMTFL